MIDGITRRFSTTPGTRDILPPESTRLREVQGRIRERFRMFGFQEVITPVLEYSEVIQEPKLRDAAFKLFDSDNQMILLRPEVTTPVARLISQRLRNRSAPYKLSYILSAYRRANVGRGQSAELYQAGVEVVGASDPREDAEVIALLVDVLRSVGLKGFAVVLGQTDFYGGYLRHSAPETAPAILDAIASKDLVRVDSLSKHLTDEVAAGVREIPRLVGPAGDVALLETASRYAAGPEAASSLENLHSILDHLKAYGCQEAVSLDFGLIGRLKYYTGVVFEAYAAGLGFTLAGGGRYDGLFEQFNQSLPATGFAISLERLLSVLPEDVPRSLAVLIGAGSDADATKAAGELRYAGVPVLQLTGEMPLKVAEEYARSVDASWVAYPAPEGVLLARLGGEPKTMTVEAAAAEVLRNE